MFYHVLIKIYQKLAKEGRLYRAGFIVFLLWLVALGTALVILAQNNLLDAAQFSQVFVLVTFGVFVGWLAMAGLAHIIAQALGGKSNYRQIMLVIAYTAWPVIIIEFLIVLFNLVAGLTGWSPEWAVGLSLMLGWLALLLGVPGLNFAIALTAVTKIEFKQATLISLMLTVFVGALIIWQYTQLIIST